MFISHYAKLVLTLSVVTIIACSNDSGNEPATSSTIASSVANYSSAISSTTLSSSIVISSKIVQSSSVQTSSSSKFGSFIDARDQKVYKTVLIGKQTWMAENLNYGSYLADLGDPAGKTQYQSGAQKFCHTNKISNCDAQGGLYQWHTAMGFAKECGDSTKTCLNKINSSHHQGICPSGWHIPKEEEWDTLIAELGGASSAGKKMKLPSIDGNNSSGFSALGAGRREINGGFSIQDSHVSFIEAEENGENITVNIIISFVHLFHGIADKSEGTSIRCLMDELQSE